MKIHGVPRLRTADTPAPDARRALPLAAAMAVTVPVAHTARSAVPAEAEDIAAAIQAAADIQEGTADKAAFLEAAFFM